LVLEITLPALIVIFVMGGVVDVTVIVLVCVEGEVKTLVMVVIGV
jgi:hypothetical protein